MKRLLWVGVIFFAGVLLGLISVHGTFNHLRHAFSPSLSFADGSAYIGDLNAQGQIDGNGRMRWKNGDLYEGYFVAGLFHGEGKLSSKSSGIYVGNFVAGEMEGQGELTYQDGSRYSGEFRNNQFNGKGRLIFQDSSSYTGDFAKGRPQGKGQWIFADGAIYIGEVASGAITGKGELTRGESKYVGDFVSGKMHGNGVFIDEAGGTYSGEFQDDTFKGQGSYVSAEGETSIGTFEDWVLSGQGIQTDKDGNQWQGEFKNGLLDGNGTFIEKDGHQYAGEFRFGKYHGKGKVIAANGDIYDGEFSYGRKHGAGTLTYKVAIEGVNKITGRWEYDRLVDGGNDIKIFSPDEVTEYAIYQEAPALARALDAIQPSDGNKIDLYSLVVAGYGTEEVFRRESKFIENLFTSQYDNRDTAIYLSNSQRSLDEHPMATRTSISAVIQRIAQQMDKEQDIFFLYITSHGGKDKTIALNHNGLSLGAVDAQWLGDLLKESGIRHRVVVLSACFSGGFVDDLADENTLVMTAAAAEKTSFGCADDSLFTYFGKAYFKESLKPGVDFEQAFYRARDLVQIWEEEQKITPSDPQIRTNKRITAHIRRWLNDSNSRALANLKRNPPDSPTAIETGL